MPDRNVTIVLPDELIEGLDLIASEINVSRSALVRRAVVRFLPNLNYSIEHSKPGDWADDLVYLLMGAPVKRTGDPSDMEFTEALDSMRARRQADKKHDRKRKKRAGRPRKSEGMNDA